ncbi:alkylation response protein AidB-like acyl-CoA dehydrogenase [Nocardia transvalensis]|uniref:Alkylation response protein AidB-like acyl-CoA dehydrogenase n=1 Tax=Nocardia transvalensis TaxID=37333 RepID=A0A7W9PG07_9NOCA|nr:acyl-CoA dehydrogenase family protein [Nocardia transvalensis]MBB5915506.1 alkylation response protein AidB-like acyl-CoA dehydrogenase [Nocardia transvalensis]
MDVRLSSEQRQLRDAAAKLADDLGPGSVADLDDEVRRARLERAVGTAGWRTLRTDGASGVEVAIVAEEFGRGLVDVAFLGPVLADGLRTLPEGERGWTIGIGDRAVDARGSSRAAIVDGVRIRSAALGRVAPGADLTRQSATLTGEVEEVGELPADEAVRWQALAVTATTADLLGTARGAQDLAVDYAKVREQYGSSIGSYQAVAHILAENQALIEGAISVLRHAAWAVDDLTPAAALEAARIAKVYTARVARTVCEASIQVHGGIGNTWDCLAHVFLRRALVSTELFPVSLKEIDLGLS